MITNKFDWLVDGISKSGYFHFKADGTYNSNFALGTWKILDERTIQKTNQQGVEYVLVFENDNYGKEATLASPVRDPPSKLKLTSKKKEDLPPGFIVPEIKMMVQEQHP